LSLCVKVIRSRLGCPRASFGWKRTRDRSDRIHHADCLIVDYRMPGMNGLRLVRTLTDMGHSAPIIMLTHSAEDIRHAVLKAGAVAVLAKREDPDGLVDAIR
jgi:two-component system response regulator FixJ